MRPFLPEPKDTSYEQERIAYGLLQFSSKPTSADADKLEDNLPSTHVKPSLDLALGSSERPIEGNLNVAESSRSLEISNKLHEEAERLRFYLSGKPDLQRRSSLPHKELFLSSGSGAYSSLTDLNSFPSNSISMKSSDINMLLSAGSGVHPNLLATDCSPLLSLHTSHLPRKQENNAVDLPSMLRMARDAPQLSSLKDSSFTQRFGGLWRHHSAPCAIQRQFPWPPPPSAPLQDDTLSSPASFRDFLSPGRSQSLSGQLPIVPEAQETSTSLRGLGEHLTLAPANSIDFPRLEKIRSGLLRRSGSTSLSLWSGKESRSMDLKVPPEPPRRQMDTEEVASLQDLNTREPQEGRGGERKRTLESEEQGGGKKARGQSEVQLAGTSSTGDERNHVLPQGSGELVGALPSQNTVLCKARAKRGFATHPRSIAERVRRTRIAENMKKLQELIPGVDKQANTADMLEDAVDYMKYLSGKVLDLSGGDKDLLKFSAARQRTLGSPPGGDDGGSSESESN